MAAEHQYFYEDEVFRINKKGNIEFGMVLENSELVSSDESDGEDGGRMKQGHIRVAWHPSGEEEVIQEKKVGLADRSLMPGDVVRRMIKGRDTQRGYCRDIKVTACVQVMGSKHVITNVSSEKLVPLEEFAVDIAVCLDSWVGGIKAVNSRLTLQCSDGSRCVVKDPDTVAGFEVFDEKRDNDCEFPHRGDYYPGQTLWGPLHGLEQATWLSCTKELKAVRGNAAKSCKTVKVMVEGVETESVAVHWQCRAYSKEGAGNEKEQPKGTIEGDDLKRLRLLNVFEPCTLQVGDRNFYTLTEHDTVSTKEQWRKVQKEEMVARCASNGLAAPAPLPSGPHTNTKRRNKRVVNLRDSRPSVKSLQVKSIDDNNELYNSSESISKTTPVDSNSVKSCSTDSSGVQVNSNNSLDQSLPETEKTLEQTTLTLADKKSEPIIKISPADSNKGDWDTTDTDDDYGTDTGSNSSTASSRASTRSGKKIPAKVNLALHFMKKKKLRRARKKPPPLVLEPGNRLVVETLSTTSSVTVVWQDGSVESAIPSTELYPIHHLDDQEFFPGDFVYEVREENATRVYGVTQSVDHAGRTARVQWFKTYTTPEDPQPTMLQQNEVSVYDLKDHPDFQYRPGTVVIRVANFEGEDANCTAGQVLDNYPEGKVRVWWVDGHISMCWPQDLYKVREYDSDDGELWDDVSTEASWETESVSSWPADEGVALEEVNGSIKPKLAANIEKARVAMSKLEEIFTQNPALQTTDVMRKLLEVYKDCRYLDKLMGTTFFHESHFQGLLERVRERGRANTAQRVGDQVRRLFCSGESYGEEKTARRSEGKDPSEDSETHQISESSNSDSGVFNSPPPVTVCAGACHDEAGADAGAGVCAEDSLGGATVCNSHVCVRLCSLILAQLVEAHAEVMRRFGGNAASGMTLSDAANTVSPAGSTGEGVAPPTPPACPPAPTPPTSPTTTTPVTATAAADPTLESPVVEPTTSLELTKDGDGGFSILDTAPNSHKFKLTMFQPTDPKNFFKTVRNEIKLLRTSLPSGIWVKGFEDRMDLFSVMIRGPEKTPYEDGLFFFDFQLSADYPKAPPLCHYVSYCSDRLNPNLYEDGKVCVSLLGTWSGKGTEVWSVISNLLQVIVSIQGLILVSEPYFNEAGYERQKGSQQGRENSRMYNEMVALKLVQSMSKLILHPPPIFRQEVYDHFNTNAHKLCTRLEGWLEVSERYNSCHPLSPTTPTSFRQLQSDEVAQCDVPLPEFPLIPASRGFCLTLRKTLVTFREVLNSMGIAQS